ncbi:isoprenyl transferase [Clostridium botulinum]|uniref:Isoprenyl transferase n=1 Tax=Clostridium botulinum TaxID=1491 RepID=A0A6B4GMB9_CLOBO|nr:isoprenyl transferase [Clostridium botulinum]KRU31523.1 ditrans,polycis-undecaprenyl-diphosphate synthase [Clostridium sporogenes]KRU32601.1 ditrans,polycis-undecaprenyl-diphosphate synthase [Clostridium sporogenes]KRU32803.1 ditrans,polycis-undecaprenyl-diphosphate synthase [Clostridium sporogenes]KRU43230.1 ditrans,polycis-undecaprenyl-diphosphate synthase [Clostridium sporogenes]MBZ1330819.1 isoprenyl transferase [Clostridium botulinum]
MIEKANNNIPKHVAIMMDGNGRWAKKRLMPRKMGHIEGSKRLEDTCESSYKFGIKYLTVYAFSTENWNRPKDEVQGIMNLFRKYLVNKIDKCIQNNMRVRVIGNRNGLDTDILQAIENIEEATKKCSGLNFQIAVNYGGKDEIIRAVNKILLFKKHLSSITEDEFSSYLDTWDIPEPDLFIRTGGDKRLSNFLLWEMAYTEFYFTDVLWPDFNEEELKNALNAFAKRERRFGQIKE